MSFAVLMAAGLCAVRPLGGAEPSRWDILTEPSRWDNFYVEGAGGVGAAGTLGGVSLFGPLYSTDEGFLYTDLRGIWGNDLDAVQSYGFGGRFRDYHELIRGMYAFYDRQQSPSGTTHQQVTLGAELLTVQWDFRINAYLPNKAFSQTQSFGDIEGDRVMIRGLTEASYYGADTEYGYLLREWREGAVELRGYIGGYWFDRSYDGFDAIVGPRVRAELRLFDLPWLGPGSRLVASGQVDWNHRDDTQGAALLTLRVPLQLGRSKPLSRSDRRMLNPIVRSPGVFLNTLWTAETAAFANGRVISETVTIDADTDNIAQTVSELPPDSLAIFDGSQGAIMLYSPLQMTEGQALVGGEGFVEIMGRTTGGRGYLIAPGVPPELVQNTASEPAIRLPRRNGQVLGIAIFSQNDGIVGENTVNSQIAGNFIAGSHHLITSGGIELQGDQRNLRVYANLIADKDYGIHIDGDVRGEISGNAIGAHDRHGVLVEGDLHAKVMHNLIGDNDDSGILVQGNLVGEVRDNRIENNGLGGLVVLGDVRGEVADNVSVANGEAGFLFEGDVRGDLTGNIGSDNAGSGFVVLGQMAGDVRGNQAQGNGRYGMHFASQITGDVAENQLWENEDNGLYAAGGVLGAIRGNSIGENGSVHGIDSEKAGLFVVGTVHGPIEDNEFLTNSGYGAYLQLEGPQVLRFAHNELSGNNLLQGDLFVEAIAGSSGPVTVRLLENSSAAADMTYPHKTYQRGAGVEFVDEGGNAGGIH